MPMPFDFKFQPPLPKYSPLLNAIGKIIVSYHQRVDLSSKSLLFHSSPLLSHQTQIWNPIVCASKKRRGSGSQKLSKIVPKLVYIAASNLKILPEPFNLVIAEFGGGDGGGLGFWKVFGDGNSDGWRRRKNTNLQLLGILVVCGLGLLLFGREQLKCEVFLCGVLASGLLVTVLIKGNKKRLKNWVLGICLVGALMGLRLRRKEMQQWLHRLSVCLPALELVKGKGRNGRRVL
ncbi:hypothetical protein JCGZ_23365 [Jatropha curcas]|uniref:Transmembrane protein n=1 Tax=Jatropha curcas TaxID=180498 RepID=A0A067JI27_JATCU|nr:uncharacterized protein LOC105647565 [Jatropha curcas]KDP23532.1 hypothetical protein JCGZ_23365 [Jatropha curcas]